MTQNEQHNEPAFFETFKEWISANNGSMTVRLYDRGRPAEQCRGITIEPATKAIATVLFIHGTGNDLIYPSITLYKFLFNEGIRICAFDLDGHGQKSTTLFSEENVATFLSWSIERTKEFSSDPLFVIGHSLGGTLALAYAAEESKDLQGLILISAPLKLSANLPSLAMEALSCFRKSIWQERKTYGILGILPAIGPFKRSSYPIRLKNKDSHYVFQVSKTIKRLSKSETLDSISCPILLIYGTSDYLVPKSNATEIQNKVRESESFLINGATHFSTIFESVIPEKISNFIRAHIR
jgi:pimeloyl-ACP methyl ester carboxylesterase